MEPNQSEQLGTLINTQPSQQALPDQNVASLVPQQSASTGAEQAKATLGNATFLQSLLLPKKEDTQQDSKQSEGDSTEPQNAPQDTETPKEEKDESGLETRLTKQIDTLSQQITNQHQSDEIARIRQELTELLKDDGQAGKN